jgi:type VI secretion system protein ImpF
VVELTPRERLQPSLLDRLTDQEPEAQQESRDRRVLSPQKLREVVRRDLGWLFNAVNIASVEDLSGYPHVARSVVNYGLPDLAGRTASGTDQLQLERMLRQVIRDFEPRILPNTLRVKLVMDEAKMSHNAMVFDIEGELWAQPLPLRLYLRTEVDLEMGEIRVNESTGGG